MVTSLILYGSVAVDASSFPTLTLKYAGLLGSARAAISLSLLSIETTSAWLVDQLHSLVRTTMQS